MEKMGVIFVHGFLPGSKDPQDSKPDKHMNGGCPWQWCAGPARTGKPKVAIMATHLAKLGFGLLTIYGQGGSLFLFLSQIFANLVADLFQA